MDDLVKRARERAADLHYEAGERDRRDPEKSELWDDGNLLVMLADRIVELERERDATIANNQSA